MSSKVESQQFCPVLSTVYMVHLEFLSQEVSHRFGGNLYDARATMPPPMVVHILYEPPLSACTVDPTTPSEQRERWMYAVLSGSRLKKSISDLYTESAPA